MSASASEDKTGGIPQSVIKQVMSEKEQEELAREAAALVKEVNAMNRKMGLFMQKTGGLRPEDIVLNYGMHKLESVIIAAN